MKRFIIQIIVFTIFLCLIGEVVIRVFKLVPDIPERMVDDYGVQRYKPGQSGYYTKAKTKWNVNEYGWLGTADVSKDTILSVIGDSYIENMMNPLECNQGSILNSLLPDYSFFEAGRSGVTFIEAMEISKILDDEIKPAYHLLYLNEFDFYESLTNFDVYTDRMQLDLKSNALVKSELKSPKLKKILYTFKLMYYMYLRFPILVDDQNKASEHQSSSENPYNQEAFQNMFSYCEKNYDLKKIVFVFHPNTDERLISLAKSFNIKTVVLNSDDDEEWGLGEHDGHWSCYGHNQVGKQIKEQLVLD